MKLRFKTASLLAIIIILFYGCKKDVENLQPVQKKTDKVIEYIKSLGLDTSKIQDLGDMYLVEGDISFPKNMTIPSDTNLKVSQTVLTTPTMNETKLMSTSIIPKFSQAYESLVGRANITNVRVFITPSAQKFSISITNAIKMWNDVGSGLKFNIVWEESDPYDIKIQMDDTRQYASCGWAKFPVNGRPGSEVTLSEVVLAASQLNSEQRIRLIAHELGHSIGLRHTNWETLGEGDAVEVPGVPGPDPRSVMNGEDCGSIGELTIKDKKALLTLYPRYINKAISKKYTQTNCKGIGKPDETTITVSAAECTSNISQEDADAQAMKLWNQRCDLFNRNVASCGGEKPIISLSNLFDNTIQVNVKYKLQWNYFYMYVYDNNNIQVAKKTGFYPIPVTAILLPKSSNKTYYVIVQMFTNKYKHDGVLSAVQEITLTKY
ncbi:hypothetical protein DHW03_12155 [Pedobacter yonginense]|uniref:DUF5977 domain-containing protein n=1 Tax=Pedobacter yonginense TaxID=651869 RepID=A0A317ENX6_9SPHI|nr:M57 family metalloprotease [Pedobacter yonginense]PWS26778.1 hypothetical protein DHW03_12155 [Pedobacter yonginense]